MNASTMPTYETSKCKPTIRPYDSLRIDLFDGYGTKCCVDLYAGSVGRVEYDSKGTAITKHMPDLDNGEFVEEAGGITNKPPLSENWGMYVRFVDQPMGFDSVVVTIESEKQKRDGISVSSTVFAVTCTEVIVQDPMLKQVYAFYIQQGNSGVELHQDIEIVNVYLQLVTSQHTIAVAKGSQPVYTFMGPNRSRGGKNAEMGAGDATNRVFATTTH